MSKTETKAFFEIHSYELDFFSVHKRHDEVLIKDEDQEIALHYVAISGFIEILLKFSKQEKIKTKLLNKKELKKLKKQYGEDIWWEQDIVNNKFYNKFYTPALISKVDEYNMTEYPSIHSCLISGEHLGAYITPQTSLIFGNWEPYPLFKKLKITPYFEMKPEEIEPFIYSLIQKSAEDQYSFIRPGNLLNPIEKVQSKEYKKTFKKIKKLNKS